MDSYSLFEVNEYIKRVMALNFEDSIWIECELNQVGEKRGNYYLELIQKSETSDEIIAKSRASIWYRDVLFIKKKLGKLFDSILQSGTNVKLKCNVEFHEVYGMSLNVKDIDINFTMGQMEMKRQAVIERLTKEDLIYTNHRLELPSVLQRIAVISSEKAAGFADFVQQLQNNAYGYAYQISLFDASVQGQKMENEVTAAVREINDEYKLHDCVVVIRGGGSKLDLSGFDNYNVAAHIAKCKLPVITGIGHEIDQTVSDLTAHTSLKTPTAVAGFLIDRNMHFEGTVMEIGGRIKELIGGELQYHQGTLEVFGERFLSAIRERFIFEKGLLSNMSSQIAGELKQTLNRQKEILEMNTDLVAANSPDKILKRGFIYATDEKGKHLLNKKMTEKKKEILLHFQDGNLKVENTNG